MKNTALLALTLILTFFSACKKDNTPKVDVPVCGPPTIFGHWKLLSMSGGITGGTDYPAAADTIYYTFNADSTYSELYHSVTTTGTYSCHFVSGHYQLSLSNYSLPSVVDTINCRLYLSTVNISDGATSIYGR